MRLGNQTQTEFFAEITKIAEERPFVLPCSTRNLAEKLRNRFYTWRRTQASVFHNAGPMSLSVKVEGASVKFSKKQDLLEELFASVQGDIKKESTE